MTPASWGPLTSHDTTVPFGLEYPRRRDIFLVPLILTGFFGRRSLSACAFPPLTMIRCIHDHRTDFRLCLDVSPKCAWSLVSGPMLISTWAFSRKKTSKARTTVLLALAIVILYASTSAFWAIEIYAFSQFAGWDFDNPIIQLQGSASVCDNCECTYVFTD